MPDTFTLGVNSQESKGSVYHYIVESEGKSQICEAFQVHNTKGGDSDCDWYDVLTCKKLPEKTTFLSLSKKCITYCGVLNGQLQEFVTEIWTNKKDGGVVRSCVYSQEGLLIENPDLILPYDVCDCDDISEPELICDSELPTELTVARPTNTPNIGWANELLETGVQLTGAVRFCYTITEAIGNTPQMVGITTTDTSESYQDLKFSFYNYQANGSQFLRIYESGVAVANVGNWSVSDKLAIERDGNTGVVTYYQNGTLVHTSSTLCPDPIQVGSSYYFANGFWGTGSFSIGDVSFCQIDSESGGDKTVQLRLTKIEPVLLAASDPELIDIWETREATTEQENILERYGVAEEELLKYIGEQ